MTHAALDRVFKLCSAYAMGLALLIYSHWISWLPLELFLLQVNDSAVHSITWMNWLGVGCLFVGVINAMAHRWVDSQSRRDVHAATAMIFGIWCVQNIGVAISGHAQPLMWLHVVGCGTAAGMSFRAWRLRN